MHFSASSWGITGFADVPKGGGGVEGLGLVERVPSRDAIPGPCGISSRAPGRPSNSALLQLLEPYGKKSPYGLPAVELHVLHQLLQVLEYEGTDGCLFPSHHH